MSQKAGYLLSWGGSPICDYKLKKRSASGQRIAERPGPTPQTQINLLRWELLNEKISKEASSSRLVVNLKGVRLVPDLGSCSNDGKDGLTTCSHQSLLGTQIPRHNKMRGVGFFGVIPKLR